MNYTDSRKQLLQVLGRLPSDKRDIASDILDIFKWMKKPEHVLVRDEAEVASLQAKIRQMEREKGKLNTLVIEKKERIKTMEAETKQLTKGVQEGINAGFLDAFFCSMPFVYEVDENLALRLFTAGIKTYASGCRRAGYNPEPDFKECLRKNEAWLEAHQALLRWLLNLADEAGILSEETKQLFGETYKP